MQNGSTYYATLFGSKDEIKFSIVSSSGNLKCSVSMFIGSETLLFSNSLGKPTRSFNGGLSSWYSYYNLIKLSSAEESFLTLKKHPNDALIFICRIIKFSNTFQTSSVQSSGSTDILYNLKTLAAALKSSSEPLSKEKVVLRVGEETETVNKAILCARSAVFDKMFQNDVEESKNNTVTITDIKMPVLRVLVSFLYSGKLLDRDSYTASNFNLDFILDLYYAADKYDITELRHLCVDLILPHISMENIFRIRKLAFSHNDALLKSSVVVFIATNIDALISTGDWKNLINEEPQIASEVLNFFDF
ncbi:Speckle-type POZ protein like [Argiope bruennichi]|uniref:Speckle-type POZ protein like n=1 Tax=Argiope bruennichi TaxID=94029 RepID=A0A8T0DYW3_ARGBR|nr:Speckle-type POZ protein like [Argiope bruennichi]